MQQTQNLKLNLIETSDPLSPAPLNENTSTLDAALADVSQRVVSLENCRLVMGRYESGQKIIDLGERVFLPKSAAFPDIVAPNRTPPPPF